MSPAMFVLREGKNNSLRQVSHHRIRKDSQQGHSHLHCPFKEVIRDQNSFFRERVDLQVGRRIDLIDNSVPEEIGRRFRWRRCIPSASRIVSRSFWNSSMTATRSCSSCRIVSN